MRVSQKVRCLQKSDFEEIWNIFFKVFERHEDEAFLNAWIHYNPALSYCVESENGIEGFLLSSNTNECIFIEFIGIHPNSQGKGLGTILLHNLLDECKRDDLSVSLVPSNSDPRLICWYEKHGFKKSGLFTKENEVIMIH